MQTVGAWLRYSPGFEFRKAKTSYFMVKYSHICIYITMPKPNNIHPTNQGLMIYIYLYKSIYA